MRVEILQLTSDKQKALRLAYEVFQQFQAPSYEKLGVQNFYNFIFNEDTIHSLKFYGAFHHHTLCGMLAVLMPNHISLFFVPENYQRQGVGTQLIQTFLNDSDALTITVNSSPYAVFIYQKFGFQKVSDEQVKDDIRFTPMHLQRK